MRKTCKMILTFILISAITFGSYATELNTLQEKKDEVQSQIDESKNNLENVDNELSNNLQQIQRLDESIFSSENSLKKLNTEIKQKEDEISKIQKDLENIIADYKIQRELLNTRLITIYESPNLKYLDVVLGTGSISDFISTYYLVSEITTYDIDLLERIQKERKDIEEKNATINSQKEYLEKQKRTEQKNIKRKSYFKANRGRIGFTG